MRRFAVALSALLIATPLLAACGGSSDKPSSLGDLTGTTAKGSSSTGGDNEFSKLIAEVNKQRFKITYTDDSGDTKTLEQDGNGNSVYGSGDSLTFISKDSTVNCEKSSDTYDCTQTPGSVGALGNPFTGVLSLAKTYFSALGDKVGHKSSKSIAGRDADCVSFSEKDVIGAVGGALAGAAGAGLKGSLTYCLDKKTGVALEVSGTDDSGKQTTSILVTKFEEPSDSDFTPPATPTKLTLPAGITIPGQ